MSDIYQLWGQTVKEAVRRFAKGQSRDNKDDFEQECWIKILEDQETVAEIHADQGEKSARNYVYGVCHNRVIELLKKNQKEEDRKAPPEDHATPFDIGGLELDDAIKRLTRDQQYVIRGMFFHGMTIENIMEQTKAKKWRVELVKKEAIEELKKLLTVQKMDKEEEC
jgi:RNA polymerase sigma factor (sigma-70 family)